MSQLIFVGVLLYAGVCAGKERLELTSDGPVVLDAPITFTGSLYNADPDAYYRWRWYDDASPEHSNTTEIDGTVTVQNFTVTYPSSIYDEYTYTMKLIVFYKILYYWEPLVSAQVRFRVSRSLLGSLAVRQNGTQTENMEGESVVDSVNNAEMVINFHDPHQFMKKALKIRYWWVIDEINYGQTNEPRFNYTFSTPGKHQVIATVTADFNSSSRELAPGHLKGQQEMGHLKLREIGVKMGLFQKNVISKAPITNVTILGEKNIKKGQLIDLNLSCDGTGPWGFCWYQVGKGYNITGNETCDDAIQTSNDCDFSIIRYYRNSDTYNLLVIVSNDVSSHLQVVAVTIYQVAKQMPLSIVIIPVTAAIAAIILLFSGIGVYANFRSNLAVEVADFDFNAAEEEELQYKTFWERLRESFVAAFTSGDDSESEGSSVSGRRSVQIPGSGGHAGSGIGYGSIT
eukprot:TRINITY_DN31877_c0_g1_i7.p1 TRINITY_DN31877_c0_g1~~TRINITY_DN31877_c0_g1_i7.p1  ORF type:complete len:457 (-),score=62.77 TRINITY_DN31877_c0_g1_i7:863-2233(-)